MPVLTTIDDGSTLLRTPFILHNLSSVLYFAKRKGILKEFANAKTITYEDKGVVKLISLIEFIKELNNKLSLEVLSTIKRSDVDALKALWEVLPITDREIIKDVLKREKETCEERDQCEDFLKEIETIEKEIYFIEPNFIQTTSPTSKAIVAGAICSVIAGLAVGGGLFAAGVALPMLALIGIAVAVALVTGLIAGGITYEMSKPSNELNEVDAQQKVSQVSEVTA